MRKYKKRKKVMESSAREWFVYLKQGLGFQRTKEDLENLRKMMQRTKKHDFDQRKGWIFEYVETLKFNKDASRKMKYEYKAHVADAEGKPHSPYDIYIKKNEDVIKKVQAKVNKKASDTAWQLANGKYEGMQRITTKDNVERVKEITKKRKEKGGVYAGDYEDSLKNISEVGLGCDGIASGGTTEKELEFIHKHPDLYELSEVIKCKALMEFWDFTWDLGEDIIRVLAGQKDKKEAIGDAKNNITERGTTFAVKVGVMGVLKKIGIKKAEGYNSISDVIVESSNSFIKFAKGEIDSKEMAQDIVYIGVRVGGNVLSDKTGIPFPIYYMYICSVAACLKTIQENDMAIKESQRLICACQQLLTNAIKQRKELEQSIEKEMGELKEDCKLLVEAFEISACDMFDINIINKKLDEINTFAELYGLELNYMDRKKFKKEFFSKKKMVIK